MYSVIRINEARIIMNDINNKLNYEMNFKFIKVEFLTFKVPCYVFKSISFALNRIIQIIKGNSV